MHPLLILSTIMLQKLIELDEKLFLFLNSKNAGWLDPVMVILSSYPCWVVGSLIMLAIIYFKSKTWKKVSSLFFALTVGISALITNIIKVIIERPRPIHKADWTDVIHALEGTADKSYSFFSSHSATVFSMAVFFFLVVRTNGISRFYGYAALIWAAAVAYSRIYVAKHYPLDVFCGTVFGIIMGIIGYEILEYFKKKKALKSDL